MNDIREQLAQAIERNGGYSSGYHDRYALTWNVSLDFGVPDYSLTFPAKVAQVYKENFGGDGINLPPDVIEDFANRWDSEKSQCEVWERVQEDMFHQLTDGDTYRTYGPVVQARYGTGVPDYYHCEWELAGRSGKHLVLTEFQHISFKTQAGEFAQDIREEEIGNDKWLKDLLMMIDEWDLCFTREKIKEEFLYQCAFLAASELNELQETHDAAVIEEAEARYWAERDSVTK